MQNNKQASFSLNTIIDILVNAVARKIEFTNPEYTVTADTMFKADADIDIYGFADVLLHLFDKTQWINGFELLIKWFAKNDCSIKELAVKIEY
ncbi:MAG: hypothetical protein B7Y19_08150, partial [Sphingobacteriales bacterium 24-40-4]